MCTRDITPVKIINKNVTYNNMYFVSKRLDVLTLDSVRTELPANTNLHKT